MVGVGFIWNGILSIYVLCNHDERRKCWSNLERFHTKFLTSLLPLQSLLQSLWWLSTFLSLQFRPPLAGAGELQTLALIILPCAHGLVIIQLLQWLQEPQRPWTCAFLLLENNFFDLFSKFHFIKILFAYFLVAKFWDTFICGHSRLLNGCFEIM